MRKLLALVVVVVLSGVLLAWDEPLPKGIRSLKTEGGTKAKVSGNAITILSDTPGYSDLELLEATAPLRKLFPRSGRCERCGIPWAMTEPHTTEFEFHDPNDDPSVSHSGFFPLCEHCWREFSANQRLKYYRRSHDRNAAEEKKYNTKHDRDGLWKVIEAAVMAGK